MSVTIAIVPRSARTARQPMVVALLVVCAAFGLTACHTKVGAAAMVGNDKITPEDMDRYIDYSVPVSDNSFAIAKRRAIVLTTLLGTKLDAAALKAHGGPVTADERATITPTVLQQYGGEKTLRERIGQAGVNPDLAGLYVDTQVAQQVLGERIHAASIADVNSALVKANPTVSVSARYGTWSPTDASIVGYQQPDFLLPVPTPAPAAQAQG